MTSVDWKKKKIVTIMPLQNVCSKESKWESYWERNNPKPNKKKTLIWHMLNRNAQVRILKNKSKSSLKVLVSHIVDIFKQRSSTWVSNKEHTFPHKDTNDIMFWGSNLRPLLARLASLTSFPPCNCKFYTCIKYCYMAFSTTFAVE